MAPGHEANGNPPLRNTDNSTEPEPIGHLHGYCFPVVNGQRVTVDLQGGRVPPLCSVKPPLLNNDMLLRITLVVIALLASLPTANGRLPMVEPRRTEGARHGRLIYVEQRWLLHFTTPLAYCCHAGIIM